MRVLVIEAIKRRTPGLLFVYGSRCQGPDIVIAGREVDGVAIAIPQRPQRAPLRRGCRVVTAFNGVPDVDDEVRTQSIEFAPDALVDSRLSVAGAIPEDGEAKIVLR